MVIIAGKAFQDLLLEPKIRGEDGVKLSPKIFDVKRFCEM